MEANTEARREGWLRRNARKQGLTATKSRRDGLWYFSDDNNVLISPEQGMSLDEAERFVSEGP
jgi:hypothetical protein